MQYPLLLRQQQGTAQEHVGLILTEVKSWVEVWFDHDDALPLMGNERVINDHLIVYWRERHWFALSGKQEVDKVKRRSRGDSDHRHKSHDDDDDTSHREELATIINLSFCVFYFVHVVYNNINYYIVQYSMMNLTLHIRFTGYHSIYLTRT